MLVRTLTTWYITLQQGLPLFRREMLVQSLRTRTYVIRSASAVILFFIALCYTAVATGTPLFSSGVRLPGQGKVILDALVYLLFAFIYVFAPATASGVITLERERQTLVLLYLTKLNSWHIVLEKFLSRVIPLLALLLLAMPLLVFAYTFGGVSHAMLLTAMWFLFVAAVQATAVAVLCSTVCQRTMQAFIVTYGVLLLLYLGPVFVDIWLSDGSLMGFLDSARESTWQASRAVSATMPPLSKLPQAIPTEYLLLGCFPTVMFAVHYAPAILGIQFSLGAMLTAGVPSLISAILCLVLARIMLFYRGFESQRFTYHLWMKRVVRRFWHGARSRTPASVHEQATLIDMPRNEPITWHEASQGRRGWLIILLALEVPALVVAVWLARTSGGDSLPISFEICGLWVISALLICVNSASLITRERNQQTLELLLTTPLTSAEIIQQKFNGTKLVMVISAIPLFSCMMFQAWWRTQLIDTVSRVQIPPPDKFLWWEYLATSALCLAIYLPLISWVALWAGLRNKSSTRATLQAMGCVIGFSCGPQFFFVLPLLAILPAQLLGHMQFMLMTFAQFSPLSMIVLAEFTNMRVTSDLPLLPGIANAAFYGVALLCTRRYILRRADVLLGRTVYY